MKKKLEKYAFEIATESKYSDVSTCYKGEQYYYVHDGSRILRLTEAVPITINAHNNSIVETLERYIQLSNEYDFTLRELPTVNEIKNEIMSLVGRKTTKVKYSLNNGEVVMNARWMYKMMYALNAKVCYVKGNKSPVFFFENDNLQSDVIGLIMPIRSDDLKTGFYAV